jgi:hypothetical protein
LHSLQRAVCDTPQNRDALPFAAVLKALELGYI